jgi:hypothetical protein
MWRMNFFQPLMWISHLYKGFVSYMKLLFSILVSLYGQSIHFSSIFYMTIESKPEVLSKVSPFHKVILIQLIT